MRRKLPEFDKGLSTLILDLDKHGLLDSTIILCQGEFGRGPRIDWQAPWNGGRNHWGQCFSSLVAGGGFKGGQVIGSSDDRGEYPATRPVWPMDIIGSMYQLMGFDPDGPISSGRSIIGEGGKEVMMTDKSKGKGRLVEIM